MLTSFKKLAFVTALCLGTATASQVAHAVGIGGTIGNVGKELSDAGKKGGKDISNAAKKARDEVNNKKKEAEKAAKKAREKAERIAKEKKEAAERAVKEKKAEADRIAKEAKEAADRAKKLADDAATKVKNGAADTKREIDRLGTTLASVTLDWNYKARVPDGGRLINFSIRKMEYARQQLTFSIVGTVPLHVNGQVKSRTGSASLKADCDVDYDADVRVKFDVNGSRLTVTPGVTQVDAKVRNLRFNNDLANTVRGAVTRKLNARVQNELPKVQSWINDELGKLSTSVDGQQFLSQMAEHIKTRPSMNPEVRAHLTPRIDLGYLGAALGGIVEEGLKRQFADWTMSDSGQVKKTIPSPLPKSLPKPGWKKPGWSL